MYTSAMWVQHKLYMKSLLPKCYIHHFNEFSNPFFFFFYISLHMCYANIVYCAIRLSCFVQKSCSSMAQCARMKNVVGVLRKVLDVKAQLIWLVCLFICAISASLSILAGGGRSSDTHLAYFRQSDATREPLHWTPSITAKSPEPGLLECAPP